MTDPTSKDERERLRAGAKMAAAHGFDVTVSGNSLLALLDAVAERDALRERVAVLEAQARGQGGHGRPYSDDRESLALELRETLRTRGHWVREGDAGPDLITAVAKALDALQERVVELQTPVRVAVTQGSATVEVHAPTPCDDPTCGMCGRGSGR